MTLNEKNNLLFEMFNINNNDNDCLLPLGIVGLRKAISHIPKKDYDYYNCNFEDVLKSRYFIPEVMNTVDLVCIDNNVFLTKDIAYNRVRHTIYESFKEKNKEDSLDLVNINYLSGNENYNFGVGLFIFEIYYDSEYLGDVRVSNTYKAVFDLNDYIKTVIDIFFLYITKFGSEDFTLSSFIIVSIFMEESENHLSHKFCNEVYYNNSINYILAYKLKRVRWQDIANSLKEPYSQLVKTHNNLPPFKDLFNKVMFKMNNLN